MKTQDIAIIEEARKDYSTLGIGGLKSARSFLRQMTPSKRVSLRLGVVESMIDGFKF